MVGEEKIKYVLFCTDMFLGYTYMYFV